MDILCKGIESMFEIVTEGGCKFRHTNPRDHWEYGLMTGSMDKEDKTVVEVNREFENGDIEKIAIYTRVVAASCVDEASTLQLPEIRVEQCMKCGRRTNSHEKIEAYEYALTKILDICNTAIKHNLGRQSPYCHPVLDEIYMILDSNFSRYLGS